MSVFITIPFFRILIPYVCGILFSILFHIQFAFLHLSICAVLAGLTIFSFRKQSFYIKLIFLLFTDVFLFMYGGIMSHNKNILNAPDYFVSVINEHPAAVLHGYINELPVEKPKTYKCEVRLTGIYTGSKEQAATGTVIVYLKKKYFPQPEPGQHLYFKTQLQKFPAPLNPEEFNYAAYMAYKQIYHLGFPDSNQIILQNKNETGIWFTGLQIKKKILLALKNSALSRDSYAICAALLTGYDDEIDKSIMSAFSHSGTLHVLSVSGLHTGLIYLVLNFLFNLIDRKKKWKKIRFILITLFLWSFALISGFSAPVLRAVIMFNLLGFGNIFFRNDVRNHINILLVSAFILLVYNPYLITDIGFLLSYFALFGLLFYQPVLLNIWRPENKILDSLWQNCCASFAATLSTLPLTLWFFKQFPLWFFLCNLIVVPSTFVILMLALLVVFKAGFASWLINHLVKLLLVFISWFNHSGTGYIDNIDFTGVDAFYLSVFLIIFSAAILSRKYKPIQYSFLVVIAWQLNGICLSYMQKSGKQFMVYHIKGCSAAAVKNTSSVTLQPIDQRDYEFHIKPHLIAMNYPAMKQMKFNYLKFGQQSVLKLDRKNCWPDRDLSGITLLILANDFKITSEDLERFPHLQRIVADGSNKAYKLKELGELCRKFGIEFYSTNESGAFILNL